jgi:hypothetical protein
MPPESIRVSNPAIEWLSEMGATDGSIDSAATERRISGGDENTKSGDGSE